MKTSLNPKTQGTFSTVNPTTGEPIKIYQAMTAKEISSILEATHKAQDLWKEKSFSQRSKLMLAAKEVLLKNKKSYAELMSAEMGKVFSQAVAEVEKCAWACDYYAQHAEEFLASENIATEAKRSFVAFKPLGTILGIMPWNYPFWQAFRFIVPTLMAGNACVLKHATSVLGSALAIEALFREAGFPQDLLRSLLVGSSEISKVIQHPLIHGVSLTGSVSAGQAVAAEAGRSLKKCVLELGGSDPFVVLEDADLEKAVEVGVISRYQNAGQSCIAAKRFIVVEKIRSEFETKFVKKVESLKVGDPLQNDTQIGPMARLDLREELHDQVKRSVAQGARILIGGVKPQSPGAFYPPTVLTDVKEGMAAWSEELFGPVASIIPVKDEAQALAVANATDFGLGASVWTRDLTKGEKIATHHIQSGLCFVNGLTRSDPRLPFGGIKKSGYGRELSPFGIREFVNVQSVCIEAS